jgi:hypothetical protein
MNAMSSTLRRFRRAVSGLAAQDRPSVTWVDAAPAAHERHAARAAQLTHLV